MKVGQSGNAKVIDLYQDAWTTGGRAAGNPPAPADRADISQKGRDLQSVMSSLKALPDVRADLVAGLKQQVASGTYRIDPQQVVAGMLQERQLYKEAVRK